MDMENSIRASGLLGKDPSDLQIVHRPPTALLPIAESQEVRRIKKNLNRKLVTPASSTRSNRSNSSLAKKSEKLKDFGKDTKTISREFSNNQKEEINFEIPKVTQNPKTDQINSEKLSNDDSNETKTQKNQKSSEKSISAKSISDRSSLNDFDSDYTRDLTSELRKKVVSSSCTIRSKNPKEAPNVYFAKYLPSSNPPSSTTFIQMNEMLDRLLNEINQQHGDQIDEIDILEYYEKYNQIFGEVVRQYFIECDQEGRLLYSCRSCFAEAKDSIPRIKAHFVKMLKEINEKIENMIKEKDGMAPEIRENKLHSKHLLKVIAEMRVELDRLVRHNDELVKAITVATNESIEMKTGIEQIDKRIAAKNQQLLELNEQLQNLSTIAAQYTNDSLTFSENLKLIRKQQEEGKLQIENANAKLRLAMQKMSRIDNEISALSDEIEKAKIEPEKMDIGAQIDLISRRLFHAGKKEEKQPVVENKVVDKKVVADNLFEKVKKEFLISIGKKADEELVVDTYEDFHNFKKVLLKNENQFHITEDEVQKAQDGDFYVDDKNPNMDLIRLFASKIASDCLDDAIRGRPLKESQTQTLAQQVNYRDIYDNESGRKGKSKFVGLIPTDYSMRSPQSFNWLISNIRTIYHEKELLNQKAFEEGLAFEDFPSSIFRFAKEKYSLDFMRDQYCWDIQITAHELRNQSTEIEMFVDFLDERYNEEQLAFFLICRKDCLKFGCSVPVRSRNLLETFNEYFLSMDQVEQLLPKWWQNRYQRKFYLKLLDFSVPRPAIQLESTKRYIASHDILLQCVMDYSDDTIDRLNEVLLRTRINPRMKMPDFTRLMKSLIPILKQPQIMNFYRSTVYKGLDRKEVTINQFIDQFFQSSILMTICKKPEISSDDKEMIETVKQEYAKYNNQFQRILDFYKQQSTLQPDNLTLKTYYDDAERYYSMLTHSLTSGDGKGCCLSYYQFIFSLDILFSTIGILEFSEEEPSLISLECSVRENWLDTIFGQK